MDATRRRLAAGLALAGAAPGLAWGAAVPQPGPGPQTRLFLESRYLPIWRAIQAAPDDPDLQQMAAFVGDEARALAAAARGPSGDTPVLPNDARAQDALAAIVEAARDRRVVMLNEAHVASRHRLFLLRVLSALRPLGFDVLAAEDFVNDSDPKAPDIRTYGRGKPLNPAFGFYLHDPVYAETVRQAAALGYRFAPYEQREDQSQAGESSSDRQTRRETAEADNFIAGVLDAHPEARVVVHCGYSHLRKTPDLGRWIWFAQRLRDKTGIDPLCVSQAFTGAFGPHAADRPVTQAVLARFQPAASIVVRGAGGVLGSSEAGADLAVFHPPLPDVEGRPGWWAADPARRRAAVAIPEQAPGVALIVQAIHALEPDPAIPADQQVLVAGQRTATLFLRPGDYRLRLETDAGLIPLKPLTVAAL